MKNILRGAVAAVALVGIATSASAQTNQRHYAGSVLGIPFTSTNPSNVPGPLGPIFTPSDRALAEASLALGIGTRYTARTTAQGDSDTLNTVSEINVAFELKGRVSKDCSFYAGNNDAARTIDFGTIGIRTGNNENVNNAFEMVNEARADIETLTAGCNTNNTVEITKTNGNLGLVNQTPGGYDSNEFQANIPYSVQARWNGVASQSGPALGQPQFLTVAENASTNSKSQGAWRSAMNISIVAPRVNGKGLVAGSYTGETKITLRAI